MRCTACRHDNREGRRFCAECGTNVAPVCAACGAGNEADEKFCGRCALHCRSRVSGSATEPPIADAQKDPRAYTPRHLADKILNSRRAVEGARKLVTVLFADVKGSMEFAEQMDPEVGAYDKTLGSS
jgi:hypothetical protein